MRGPQDCLRQIDSMLDRWEEMSSSRQEEENEVRQYIFDTMWDDDDCHLSMAP